MSRNIVSLKNPSPTRPSKLSAKPVRIGSPGALPLAPCKPETAHAAAIDRTGPLR